MGIEYRRFTSHLGKVTALVNTVGEVIALNIRNQKKGIFIDYNFDDAQEVYNNLINNKE